MLWPMGGNGEVGGLWNLSGLSQFREVALDVYRYVDAQFVIKVKAKATATQLDCALSCFEESSRCYKFAAKVFDAGTKVGVAVAAAAKGAAVLR